MWQVTIVDHGVPEESCLLSCRIDVVIVNTWTMNRIVQGKTPRQEIEVLHLSGKEN